MYFQDKVVWITGASSGIGESLAYEFAQQGAKLVLSGRKEQELERVKAACSSTNEIFILPFDVTHFEKSEEMVGQVIARFGKVDILVNNAGISQRSLIMDTKFSVIRRIMEVNYFGSVALTNSLLPKMMEHGGGQIVVISSVVGKAGVPGRSAYGASKHALHGYFDALRAELNQQNIKVTIICPGYVQTQISMNALTGSGAPQQKMDTTTANGLRVDDFARKALRAIAKERNEVYLGGRELIAIYLNRFFPSLYASIIRRFKVKSL